MRTHHRSHPLSLSPRSRTTASARPDRRRVRRSASRRPRARPLSLLFHLSSVPSRAPPPLPPRKGSRARRSHRSSTRTSSSPRREARANVPLGTRPTPPSPLPLAPRAPRPRPWPRARAVSRRTRSRTCAAGCSVRRAPPIARRARRRLRLRGFAPRVSRAPTKITTTPATALEARRDRARR